MSTTTSRRKKIISHLRGKIESTVIELSDSFRVSAVTIRKDLQYLSTRGCVVREHGRVKINPCFIFDEDVEEGRDRFNKNRTKIAKCAAGFIDDGDSIIIESDPTASRIVSFLDVKNLVVMTNSIVASHLLAKNKSIDRTIEILVPGGKLLKHELSTYGSDTENTIKNYHFDKLFIGVDGFEISTGITTPNEIKASLSRTMCEVSREVIAVTDSTKLGKMSFCVVCETNRINKIIVDKKILNEELKKKYYSPLLEMGVEVIIA